MATFFGEVILPSSRVFFEDDDSDVEDDTVSERRLLELNLLDDNSLKVDYELLLIVEGTVSRGFAEVYLLNEKTTPLAEIYLPKEENNDNLVEISPHKEDNSILYKLNNKTLLLKTSPSLDLTLANQLTLKVMPWLEKSKTVLIFNSKAVSDYRCESIDTLPASFEKTLTTSAVSEIPSTYQRLEQPNFISGFSASVASWCECMNKPCTLHINYTDKSILDSITTAPLLKIMNTSNLSHLIVNENIDSSKFGISCDQSYMYM
ncbi:hypothetical protein O3M35_003526 [Rhynocoris fuscipes]|uniref:Proteasome assembly chaperone 1 n=1 Tax=Rhynocoris fuscipes TaxID=488301 RepID=A0AAW1CJ83_9HEMI